MKNFLLLLIFVFAQSVNLTAQESEHPPLSESTKKAIADYKRNPSENNRLELVKVLNDNYDAVIQNKKDNLERRIRERDKNINRWLQSVKSGGVPPFMKLNTENHKGDERKEVAAAIEDYKNKPSAKNENKVKKALNNYYDAFLFEQEKHIKDTEQSREARLTASFERFTSDRFRPKARQGQKLNEDDVLSEIICNYISIGSEIVPVNPEARVRERGFNAAINSAQSAYLKNPTTKNRELLKDEVTKAFRTAYDVRVEEFSKAKKKGDKGAVELSDKIIDDKFRNTQFEEITQQLNLYGRIDRMVTFGNNTFGNWQPRMRDDSRELAKLIREYKSSSDNESKEAVKNKFFMIYNEMLTVHEKHLYKIESEIDGLIEKTVGELID